MKDLTISLMGSAICGSIVGWLMMGVSASPYTIGAMCGIAGLMGDKGLHMLEKVLIKKINSILEATPIIEETAESQSDRGRAGGTSCNSGEDDTPKA